MNYVQPQGVNAPQPQQVNQPQQGYVPMPQPQQLNQPQQGYAPMPQQVNQPQVSSHRFNNLKVLNSMVRLSIRKLWL